MVEEQFFERQGEQRQGVAVGSRVDVRQKTLVSCGSRFKAVPASLRRSAGLSITSCRRRVAKAAAAEWIAADFPAAWRVRARQRNPSGWRRWRMQRPLPSLGGRDASNEMEKYGVPSLARRPIPKRDGLEIVLARTANAQSRFEVCGMIAKSVHMVSAWARRSSLSIATISVRTADVARYSQRPGFRSATRCTHPSRLGLAPQPTGASSVAAPLAFPALTIC